jgi:flagellum-specific peptidoglycan hydrolase FlgJ
MNEIIMNEYVKTARPIAAEQGFDELILLTHAYHESGGFEKVIGANNFWGLKVPVKSSWDGLTAKVWTHEYESIIDDETQESAAARIAKKYACANAQVEKSKAYLNKWLVKLPQTFRDWQTPYEAIRAYIVFIYMNYFTAYEAKADYQNYFKRLVDGKLKYATDPDYAKKCENLYVELKKKFNSRQK